LESQAVYSLDKNLEMKATEVKHSKRHQIDSIK